MFETAIGDGSKKLCGSSSWRRDLGLKLLIGVIDEIFFGRHDGDVW
jgi:hypothetical protein